MPDNAQKPGNALTAMRWAATKLFTAYKVAQTEENDTKTETLILEAIELSKHAITLLRRGK